MRYWLLLTPVLLFSQSWKVNGYVRDDSTHQLLPFATIRVEHSDIVTSSNKDGRFVLDLGPGEHWLMVTYVGFNPQRKAVTASIDSLVVISLLPAVIQLPEVAVSADDEDPAAEIMRMAIRNREKNYQGLKNYEVTGYKKNILYSGEQIAMIDEQFVKQIYEKGKMNKEFILSTHKTENIKKQNLRISLNIGLSLFFVNGDLNIKIGAGKSNVIFPLADNAFEYYNFKLLNSKVAGKDVSHTIEIIPRSSVEPLLKGKIIIDDATSALIGADVESSDGWSLPMVKGFSMKIQQTYADYGGFWIPQYSEVELSGELSALGGLLALDKMEISEVFSASTCKVNGTLPDSITHARRSKYGGYTSDTTKPVVKKLLRYRKTKQEPNPAFQVYEPAAAPTEISSSAMDTMRPLPLTTKEKIAFRDLDSSKTLEKIVQPKGALGALSSSDTTESVFGKIAGAVASYGIIQNNRAEGITLGAHRDVDEMTDDFYYHVSSAYAFGAERVEWEIGGGYNLGDDHLDRVDANIWNSIEPWQSSRFISKTVNTGIFTLTGKDFFNYYRSSGYSVGIHKYFTDSIFIKMYFSSDDQRSIVRTTYASLVRGNRINPAILEGRDNSLQVQFGFEPLTVLPIGFLNPFTIRLSGVISHPSLGSDFNYQQVTVSGNMRMRTFYSTMFVAPYLLLTFEGGFVTGTDYGIQHLRVPSGALSFYAPAGVLKGKQNYDLAGSKFASAQIEHNWQSLPFSFIGLKSIEETGLQVLTGASLANIWNTSAYLAKQSGWKPYWEAYIGLANIFDLLRMDVVHSSSQLNVVRISISSAVLN